MSDIRLIDMIFVDDLLEMGGGYVLNFSDRTFTQFFADELNININNPIYAQTGSSKGKRLRCFFQTVDNPIAIHALKALWEYREALRQRTRQKDTVENAYARLTALINRLEGHSENAPFAGQAPMQSFDRTKLAQIKIDLLSLTDLAPQARGYAFEKFLKQFFDGYK